MDTKVQEFRELLNESLQADFSWLSLAGLFWLTEGENSFGTDPNNPIQLPPATAPAHAGAFTLTDGQITVTLEADVQGLIDGEVINHVAHMLPDTSGTPTYLHINDLRFGVIERGGELAIRLWWRKHPNRLNFSGRKWYPDNETYRLTATIEPFDPPKVVLIPDMIGNETESVMDAVLVMKLNGETIRLEGRRNPDNCFSIVFKDATAGKTTYPAARFLITQVPEGDQVVVDFNKAYSPPCAYTDFATCPLPLPQNILSQAIEAGEQYLKQSK